MPTHDVERGSRRCCYQLDPTKDPRWAEFVATHPNASVFHTTAWLEALRRTYGYDPIAFTTSPANGPLKNGIVFSKVKSWLTGSRLVSLPFSDHCEPLCDSREELDFLIRYLQTLQERENWKYLQIRLANKTLDQIDVRSHSRPTARYFLHVLDLDRELHEVFRGLDKDSVQRRIHHADRVGLVEKSGRSEGLLREFYNLFVITRRRHRLPATPSSWFTNLIRCQGKAAEIRVAYYNAQPIAAILTLRFREVLYYKYGCSSTDFNRLGAMPWLLWNAIVAAKATGATTFDMGRTQEDHAGVLAFKQHWVSTPRQLRYWSFPGAATLDSTEGWRLNLAKGVFSHMPRKLLTLTGRVFYRHIG